MDRNRPLIDLLVRIRYEMTSMLGHQPLLFFPWRKLFRPETRDRLVDKNTELVIEGFPRSGNTFAVAAFTLSQSRSRKLAHHTHKAAQVIRARQLGIPTLFLLRKPLDAVISFTIFAPEISPRQALRSYIRFHRHCQPVKNGLYVACFEEVANHFDRVIEGLNNHFGTSFDVFHPSQENMQACFALIDQMDRDYTGREKVTESMVARPVEERENQKTKLKKIVMNNPKFIKSLNEAEKLYQSFLIKNQKNNSYLN